jgi:DNA-binding NarL/FixJ family response regulator
MKIVLAYPHRLLRDSMRPLLRGLAEQTTLCEADTIEATLTLLDAQSDIALVLLGDDLPGMADLAAIQLIRHRFPKIHIVLLSNGADPITVLAAVAAGVSGVIFQSISADALLGALRLVLMGEIYLPSTIILAIAALSVRLLPAPSSQSVFSPAEAEVVPLLLSGLCNKLIAQQLGIEEPAVKARLRSIYKKIGVFNRAQAVMTLMAEGNPDITSYRTIA